LLINNLRANYRREPNIHREGYISGETARAINVRTTQLEKEEIANLADEYVR